MGPGIAQHLDAYGSLETLEVDVALFVKDKASEHGFGKPIKYAVNKSNLIIPFWLIGLKAQE